ncbi:vacuolar segregation subunit 7-domain-containing protein [Hyaloscypha sp. PMI_1271]|nr:vacuolar segregation subunit 7-domain-containing protein [Hyaloscypha sp. PMI_1271]
MDDKHFAPITGTTQETAEAVNGTATPASEQTAANTSKPARDTSIPPTKKLLPKRTPSAASSPNPSRESSPNRPSLKTSISARSTTAPSRSRKNSTQDVSPSRSASTNTNPPSAAAQQRALSAASIPALHPASSETTIKAPVPQKPSVTSDIKEPPRWPVSPRLRSPPPVTRPSIISPRKTDQEFHGINVHRIPHSTEQQEGKATTDSEAEDTLSVPGMRTPARGASGGSSTLETVQEISQPNTPGNTLDGALERVVNGTSTLTEENPMEHAGMTLKSKPSLLANESGSESGGKGEIKMRSASVAPPPVVRPSGPASKPFSAGVGRGKPSGEGSSRNMTVETETVSSIPQVAVGGPAGGSNGSIRAKPSSETIRPKKEKKKTARKAPSVTSGTASTKADIFEAKVASAVDEANSSDSEETFVYESNPPDANDRPRRFHSRTPSATSMASQVDQRNGVRAFMDGQHSVAMKKSMKFANSYNSTGPDSTTGDDDGKGTARSNMGTGRGTTHHHHIGGRWGRNGGNGHPSLFDNESPFPNATKPKVAANTPRYAGRPESPRVGNVRMAGNGKKSQISSGYDLDDGADDERTPLMSTVRSSRSNRSRRPLGSSMRQLEHQASRHNRSFLARFAGCLVVSVMIIFVISGAIAFIFATTQPLEDVEVLALKNVLASEQDVILDMKVQARNPNLVGVTIDSTDLVVFAKSKYAGTDSEWWQHPHNGDMKWGLRKRDDDPMDPPQGDDPNTNLNLEIGYVYEFDSPLTFDGSPFSHQPTSSLGQIRVTHPGNKTVPAGSERWGRVLQHEFELIVRGTLKYTLPLSQRLRSISVKGQVTVQPNAADQDPDTVHIIV